MSIQTEFNAGYHIAELELPDAWPLLPRIDEWCEQTFGAQDIWGEDPVTGWKRMRNKYFFTDEAKLNWFILRWL
jgi:hypothetical protein